MRRRRTIEVWPAFADLMTILAVPGLFLAMSLLGVVGEDFHSAEELARQNRELKEQLADALELVKERLPGTPEDPEALRRELRERARNAAMFRAIQDTQRIIDELAGQSDLHFSADQTLRFGDDLVTFDLNSTSVTWKEGGRSRLRQFCESLGRRLAAGSGSGLRAKFFQIEVEGHTDATSCVADEYCNWRLSSGRAVAFLSQIQDPQLCPGGRDLDLKPVGYADTKPETESGTGRRRATRRIALRIVPDYQAILAAADQATRATGS